MYSVSDTYISKGVSVSETVTIKGVTITFESKSPLDVGLLTLDFLSSNGHAPGDNDADEEEVESK